MSVQQKKKLTLKQHRFVVAYMGEAKGNATQAARIAGYSGSDNTLRTVGQENMTKPAIISAIEEYKNKEEGIATREDILRFWSDMLNDESVKETHRIRCAENLARCYAMFIERRKIEGALKIDDTRDKLVALLENATIVDQLEQIENELLSSKPLTTRKQLTTSNEEIDA